MTLHDRRIMWLSVCAGTFVFFADRLHKFIQLVLFGWTGGEWVPVTSFFNYVLVWNTGVSYGLLDGLPPYALLAIMAVAMALLAWWWVKAETALVRFGLAICLGGAVSHVIDRILYGAVADFFHFHWGDWSFYVFNISDTAITLGVVLLLLDLVWPRPKAGQAAD